MSGARRPRAAGGELGETGAMDILYIAVSGRADPVRAGIPFHLAANGSAEVGQAAEIVLAGDATDILLEGVIDALEPLGMPPLRELVATTVEKGIAVHV